MSGVPTWDRFMAPSLRLLSDGLTHKPRDIREAAADELGLTSAARDEVIPSGQRRWENRKLGYVVSRSIWCGRQAGTRELSDHGGWAVTAGPTATRHNGS